MHLGNPVSPINYFIPRTLTMGVIHPEEFYGGHFKGSFFYYVSQGRGGRGFEQMLTFAYRGGEGEFDDGLRKHSTI